MGHFNIAVDGPAGAGKSTIARMVAEKLGFVYVDTGAMYRTMALHFIRLGISPGDEEAIARACRDVDVTICYKDGAQQVMLNGENVTGLIRTEEVGGMASATSVYAPVRKKLVELQQELARKTDVIMDMNREHSPLRQAEDAVLLDSSGMTIEQVADAIIRIACERGLEVGA